MKEDIKNLPNLPGIYKITSPNGLVYIGETKNLKKRCLSYLSSSKIKGQRAIYNSILKYSVDRHKIEILELCDEESLLERERYYQEIYDSVENGLNCFYTSTFDKKKIWSEKTIKKMSDNQKGENNSFYGKKHSIESLKKISENSKGINNPNYGGKCVTEEWKLKQSKSNSKKHIKVVDTFTDEVLFFINSKECALKLNAKPSNVRMCKNNYKLMKRYIITDVE
jgi:group I intron endonuclease